jgi:hypothetical protein
VLRGGALSGRSPGAVHGASMTRDLIAERQEAATKAIDSLARYKFMMFGYWAAIWVHLNSIAPSRDRSPFAFLVVAARQKVGDSKEVAA